jgi:CheY-like chemotaxis protein
MGRPAVLLAGGSARPRCELAERLARWGAQCNFANTWEEVCRLLDERNFDLVVCEANLPGGSALQAIPMLADSPTTLFYSFPVEDSCLWIQVVKRGHACGRPFVWRPNEFLRVLRQTVKDVM